MKHRVAAHLCFCLFLSPSLELSTESVSPLSSPSSQRFAAAIMRIRAPKTTALIFSSGKMVCTGAKTEALAREAARKYAKVISKLGFPAQFKVRRQPIPSVLSCFVRFVSLSCSCRTRALFYSFLFRPLDSFLSPQEFKIQNMVGSCDVKFPIRLEGLAWSHGHFAQYEPELFPGLIYRMQMPKIVLLIFVSGKIVLTGGKKREDIYQAFENIYPVLTEFRKLANPADEGPLAAQLAGGQTAAAALPAP